MCDMTKEECDEKLKILNDKVVIVSKAKDSMNDRIYYLDEELVKLANDINTTPKQFADIETIIDRYSRLHARISNKLYVLNRKISEIEESRRYCKNKCLEK